MATRTLRWQASTPSPNYIPAKAKAILEEDGYEERGVLPRLLDEEVTGRVASEKACQKHAISTVLRMESAVT